jgi:Domain of unknown function (DUF4124)
MLFQKIPKKILAALVLGLFVRPALADLYRWADPETGSVKFSSYPPPWYGDAGKERGAPKVERIPAQPQGAPAPSEPVGEKVGTEAAPRLEALEAQRKQLLRQIGEGAGQSPELFKRRVQAYQALSDEMDKADPAGARARAAQARALLEHLAKGAR